jgi:hypothetical protein
VSLSQTVSTNTANAGLLTSRVKTLEDAKLSAVIAALSAEASATKASLSTTQSVLNKTMECQKRGQYLETGRYVCKFVFGKDIPARYVSMQASLETTVNVFLCCSCQAILDADNDAETGTYNIQGVLTGCYMKDGKGWMLVMKIPSTNQDKFFCKNPHSARIRNFYYPRGGLLQRKLSPYVLGDDVCMLR